MRPRYPNTTDLGAIAIGLFPLKLKGRDEFPFLLLSLQHIYNKAALREQIIDLLQQCVDGEAVSGRVYGMSLWQIFVLGVVRVGLGIDYDKLCDLAENHYNFRGILGVGNTDYEFSVETIKDNVVLLEEDCLKSIHTLIAQEGQSLLKKKHWKNLSRLKALNKDQF